MRIQLFVILSLAACCADGKEVDFAHEIVPLLKSQCGKCHTGTQAEGGLSLNTRETLLVGGDSGAAIVVGKSGESEFFHRVTSDDESTRMPPEGEPLTASQVELIARWIDQGAFWEPGYTFNPKSYEPPLKPRQPSLPAGLPGRDHPIDRILDHVVVSEGHELPKPLSENAFARRAYLDLIGLLPTPEELEEYLNDSSSNKRERLVQSLLARDIEYAEHWLTFWNDLLRNDYAGTGFITSGRKQISRWLYEALVNNMPYDEFVRELVAPKSDESSGFSDGIRWRGEVSAGQTVEIQFAQSVGQAFLGINLKCASCHDSFIDRWKLDDAYGLAAIYSQRPLELHRCDKPIGQVAKPAWLFDELGQVDPTAAQPERLAQLASLLTHRENGRFTRTIVNRLWHRMMGRGIVHPTDAMETEPWNEDLLDYLAEHLVASGYDLKQTLQLIATSKAYQSVSETVTDDLDASGYRYAGPRSKRMTAEQFMDCVWQLTDTAPKRFDAPIVRGKRDPKLASDVRIQGSFIWSRANTSDAKAGETITIRKSLTLDRVVEQATAIVSCDNSYSLSVNGKHVGEGADWEQPDLIALPQLKAGENEIVIVAKNGGAGANPAGLFAEVRWKNPDGTTAVTASDASWQWSASLPDKNGKFKAMPEDWQPAVVVDSQAIWMSRVEKAITLMLSQGQSVAGKNVRASLLKSDFLTRSLGRPNRDQIVTVRPLELTTLEAIDLSNGQELAMILASGAKTLQAKPWESTDELVRWLFLHSLSREPSESERIALVDTLTADTSATSIEDVLWAILMLPEFQLVR